MTESTHTYTAALIGSPDVPLTVRGGRIGMSDANAPHVTGSIDIAVPSLTVLTALDPRADRRIRITAVSDLPGIVARPFDLSLRDRTTRLADAVVTLDLASDESLLDDYAQPVADDGAYSRQGSLRAIVDYVLGKAIPGASLAAFPALDVDASVYADAENYVPNGSGRNDLTGWTTNNSSLARLTGQTWLENVAQTGLRVTGSAGSPVSYIDYEVPEASDMRGRMVRFHARQRNGATALTGTTDANVLRITVFGSNDDAASYYPIGQSTAGPTGANAQRDHDFMAVIPDELTNMVIRLHHGVQIAAPVTWGDVIASEYTGDPSDKGYWDGDTPGTDGYAYIWMGPVGASASARAALIDRPPATLRWEAGESAMSYLASVVQPLERRLVCDETRTWTLRDENYEAPGSLAIRYGLNLIDGTDKLRRGDNWFDAALVEWKWEEADGTHTATDFYALTTPYTRLVKIELTTPYSGAGYAAYLVRRAQGRGREVTARIVADWRARAEQPVEITLDGAPIQTGRLSEIEFDLNSDELTITTRSVDTPPSAWVLIPTGSTWDDEPVGGSWTGEVV